MKPWFDEHGWLLRRIPPQAARECSRPGDSYNAVDHWVTKLRFDGPAGQIAAYLAEYGAWSPEELTDHHANVRRLFWLFACEYAEGNRIYGLQF